MKPLNILLAGLLLLTGCSAAPAQEPAQSTLLASSSSQEVSPPVQTDPRQEAIHTILSSMTPEEKVGQLFFARCPAQDGAALASEYHLGG